MTTATSSIAAVATGVDALGTLHRALQEIGERSQPNLLLLFASSRFADEFSALVAEAGRWSGASIVAGCSGQAIIGNDREIEGEPAISVLAFAGEGAWVEAVHVTQADIDVATEPEAWRERIGVPAGDPRGWLLFVDPFTVEVEALIERFETAYPGVPVVGGLASGEMRARRTHVFLDGRVHSDGAIAVAIGGEYAIRTVVSQGAEPIGEAWTVTGVHQNHIETIGNRPAYEVLVETVRGLGAEQQHRARTNLLAGLAIDERRDTFGRGDFLIRNLVGADAESGSLAVAALPRVGQTIQFQLRDADAADDELRALLKTAHEDLGGVEPAAALVCTCNGRGAGLFGRPDHDAGAVAELLGSVPAAGFFCNGEIGPVGRKTFVHGFTATVGIIVRPSGSSCGSRGPNLVGGVAYDASRKPTVPP
jgi:small ligand-binding sensory domain FIST